MIPDGETTSRRGETGGFDIGFLVGVVQQVQASRAEAERTTMLKYLYAKAKGEADAAPPEASQALSEIAIELGIKLDR